jgi:hypothetical protein
MRFAPKFRTVSKSILFLGIRQRDSAAPLFFAWLDAADMLRSGSVRRFATDGLGRRPTIKDNCLVQRSACSSLFLRNRNLFGGDIAGRDQGEGLIEGKESGSLLLRQYTSDRSLCSTFLSLRFVSRLDGMRVDDCPNEPGKALLELRATRGVMDFHAAALTPDQPRLS